MFTWCEEYICAGGVEVERLRTCLKIYLSAVFMFIAFSLILACLIHFSGFRERWTFAGLMIILTAVSLFLGMLQAAAAEKRGVIIGLISAGIFVVMIIGVTGCIFAEPLEPGRRMIFYIIPVVAGGIGGIAGAGWRNE